MKRIDNILQSKIGKQLIFNLSISIILLSILAAITEEFAHFATTLPIVILGIILPILNTFSQHVYSNDDIFDEFIMSSTQKNVWIVSLPSGLLLLVIIYPIYQFVEYKEFPLFLAIVIKAIFYMLLSISFFLLLYPLLMILIRMLKKAIDDSVH